MFETKSETSSETKSKTSSETLFEPSSPDIKSENHVGNQLPVGNQKRDQ